LRADFDLDPRIAGSYRRIWPNETTRTGNLTIDKYWTVRALWRRRRGPGDRHAHGIWYWACGRRAKK